MRTCVAQHERVVTYDTGTVFNEALYLSPKSFLNIQDCIVHKILSNLHLLSGLIICKQ